MIDRASAQIGHRTANPQLMMRTQVFGTYAAAMERAARQGNKTELVFVRRGFHGVSRANRAIDVAMRNLRDDRKKDVKRAVGLALIEEFTRETTPRLPAKDGSFRTIHSRYLREGAEKAYASGAAKDWLDAIRISAEENVANTPFQVFDERGHRLEEDRFNPQGRS